MRVAVCVKNLITGKMEVIPPGKRIDANDPIYADDIHLVPVKEDTGDPDTLDFGIHEFSELCFCHPQRQESVFGRTMIIHSERVN